MNLTEVVAVEGASLKAKTKYLPGDEVFDGYSAYQCNVIWLMNYGFIQQEGNCYCDYSSQDPANIYRSDREGCNEAGHSVRPANDGIGDPRSHPYTNNLGGSSQGKDVTTLSTVI